MTNLFSNEHRQTAVLLVDLQSQSHEPQQVGSESQTPDHDLPVTHVIQVCVCIFEHLLIENSLQVTLGNCNNRKYVILQDDNGNDKKFGKGNSRKHQITISLQDQSDGKRKPAATTTRVGLST